MSLELSRRVATLWSLAISCVIMSAASAAAHQVPATQPTQVLVLGSYHFDNPGLDVVRTEIADVFSSEKQQEIARVVAALRGFEPDRVAVEQLPEVSPRLDSLYSAYRRGEHQLGRSEVQQLGFRLAALADHDRVHPIDHRGEFPFGPVMEWAAEHDPEFVAFVGQTLEDMAVESRRRQGNMTVGQILRLINEPGELAANHGFYLRLAAMGAGDSWEGADLLAGWYERNIRMFLNIHRLARPGGRVLAIVGSGHAPIMRELVAMHPDLQLVDALQFLPDQ